MNDKIFNKMNYYGILAGILFLVAGFYALSRPPVNGFWTLNIAPILLSIAYCVIIPLAIIWNKKSDDGEEDRGA
jgi:hypothetical protein